MKYEMLPLSAVNIEVIDGDRGKNYPHQSELFDTGDCLFLSAKNVTKSGFVFSEKQYITREKDQLLNNGKIERGDIVITTRGTVGNVAMYSSEVPYNNIRINSGMLIIRCGNNINPNYLYYILKSEWFQKQITAMQSGSAQPQLPKSHFLKMNIPLPDYKIQQKIANVLKKLDKKIAFNNAINDNLEQQAQALFEAWFVDFLPFGGNMPLDWEVEPFEKIIDFQNGYAFKSKELLNAPTSNSYQVFKQGHIARGGGFIPDGTKSWFPKELASKLERFVLKKGDILMAMTDMKDNVAILGNTAIMPIDNEYIVNQRVGHLRANGYKGITYPFIYLLTNSKDFLTDLRSRANSGVQVNLSSTEIKASKVLLPSKEVNVTFSAITLPMFETIINNQLENQSLSQLRDDLLPKLISGELDVSNLDL